MLMKRKDLCMKRVIVALLSICMLWGTWGDVTVFAQTDENVTAFESRSDETVEIQEHVVTLGKKSEGDHFAMHTGSEGYSTFTLEADVKVTDGISAALVFGADGMNPSENRWYAANFNNEGEQDNVRVFCVDGELKNYGSHNKASLGTLDLTGDLHMLISVNDNGDFIYKIKNNDVENEITLKGTLENWSGGQVGLLTFKSEAAFSNILISDTYYEEKNEDDGEDENTDPDPWNNDEGLLHTNLAGLSKGAGDGSFEIIEEGLHGTGAGDNFVLSQSQGTDFVYETDVTFREVSGAASLVFRSDNQDNPKNSYVANINRESGEARLFKFQNNEAINLGQSMKVEKKDSYHLKVVALGKHILYYVDDILVGNTGDYVLSPSNDTIGGQNTAFFNGYYGLLSWNTDAVYQNIYYTEITDENSPLLSDLQLNAIGGTVEASNNFKSDQYTYLQYVDNNTKEAEILPTAKNENTEIIITDRNGDVTDTTVPLEEGENLFTVTASLKITNEDSQEETKASVVYRYFIHKRAAADSYYNEPYRGQYHYSVKDGWANDPNGMVYYNGEWHLFYQFYNDTNHGPMHWAHAVSTDLVHWEERPITFYPDEYGTMFSGCAVVDEHNTSGLFGEGDEGGLVALITAHGNGQRVIVAYSKDGENWDKASDVAIDWTDDPLNSRDFRDPKVFRYENKWFMVIAGGPLRIYSSDNLRDWQVESTYPDLHTECPDLYRLPYTQGDQTVYKWVLSRGGRAYKVGDFTQVDGKWTFVADEAYKTSDGIMNFGKDSYAAMTYYINPFDDAQPRVIEVNWMNNWDYCQQVDDASNNDRFNGTFNLQLELGLLKSEDGTYLLTQTPISEYESLRNINKTQSLKEVRIRPGENILEDFRGDTYEIVATFKPETNVDEVGFYVRKGENNQTKITYNRAAGQLSVDRSNSGASPGHLFSQNYVQDLVVDENGEIKLHIFVDRSSVEVFGQNYTMACGLQIFPEDGSEGLEVFSVGGETEADIEIYHLDNIWNLSDDDTTPKYISINQKNATLYQGTQLELKASVMPKTAPKDIIWDTEDSEIVKLTETSKGVKAEGLKAGTALITATSASNPEVKGSCRLIVRENRVQTNITDWQTISGEWYADGDYYLGKSNDNAFFYSGSKNTYTEYVYEADVMLKSGIVNLIFGSGSTNAYEGCYSVQLSGSRVRLFDFRNDHTFEQKNSLPASDNDMYHVVITVLKNEQNQNVIKIEVNDAEYINYTVTDESRTYDQGYFALGVYNTEAKFYRIYTSKSGKEAAADQEKADQVIAKIKAIGKVVFDAKSKALIDEARQAYDDLSVSQKDLVTNIDDLTAAENQYDKLKQEDEEKPKKVSLSKVTIAGISTQYYTGKALRPAVKMTYGGKSLKLNQDYTVSYSNNTKIGTAKVTITGKGTYTGSIVKGFSIKVKKNAAYTIGNLKYKITNTNLSGKGTVTVTGVKSKSIKKITVPETVNIGGKKFKVTVIGKAAFKNLKEVTKAVIGKNVKTIEKEAFKGCKKLGSININSSKLTKVKKDAIKGIKAKATISCPKKQKAKYKKLFTATTGFKKTMKIK